MSGFDRQRCLDEFILWLHQPFVNVFPVSQERADLIAHDHFQGVRDITDEMVQRAVRVLQDCYGSVGTGRPR